MLVAAREDGCVLLERRPEQGVWGGLWCLPEFATEEQARAFVGRALDSAPLEPRCSEPRYHALRPLEPVRHAFTHFDLTITPLLAPCRGLRTVLEAPEIIWYNPREPASVGLPAPVRALLERIDPPGTANHTREAST